MKVNKTAHIGTSVNLQAKNASRKYENFQPTKFTFNAAPKNGQGPAAGNLHSDNNNNIIVQEHKNDIDNQPDNALVYNYDGSLKRGQQINILA